MLAIQIRDSYEPGTNVFLNNSFHIGQCIGLVDPLKGEEAGNRMMLLTENHSNEKFKYFVLVNEATGERVCIRDLFPNTKPDQKPEGK